MNFNNGVSSYLSSTSSSDDDDDYNSVMNNIAVINATEEVIYHAISTRNTILANYFNQQNYRVGNFQVAGSFSGSKDDPSCSDKGPWNCSSGPIVKSENAKENAEKSTGSAKAVPLGLGLGSLERKRRKRLKPLTKNGDGGTTSTAVNQDQQAATTQQVLQSLAARSSVVNMVNSNNSSPGQLPSSVGQVTDGGLSGGQGSAGQVDTQVLSSPALNGLLTGESEQTGMGSSDGLRNMLQQFAQNPLPIVSRALGSGSTAAQSLSLGEPQPQPQYNQRDLSRDERDEQNLQEYVELLQDDMRRRLEDDSRHD